MQEKRIEFVVVVTVASFRGVFLVTGDILRFLVPA